MDKVNLDLNKKDYFFSKNFYFSRYLNWQYPKNYLNDVNFSWGFDRRYYVEYIKKHLGQNIKDYYGGSNFRVELVEMFKTPKGTKNVNANFHVDGDCPGSLKFMIYLSDVDENSGPLAFKTDDEKEIKEIKGEKGTVIFFNNRKTMHAGMPSISKERTVLTFLVYPTLRNEINYQITKPINALCNLNPFSKLS